MPRDFTPPDDMPSEKWLDLVVWVPKYFKANVGHAAMKIRSTDIKGKTKRLLLGHCVACAFYEDAHLGEYINLIDPQKDGAIVCLPTHQFIHYSGPIIEPVKQAEKLLTDGMQTVLKNVVSQTIN